MKKILIRVESHSKSGVGGMESRIFEFCKILKYDFTFLTNSEYLIEKKFFGENKMIFSNYFSFFGILKDIFTFRNFEIIESNGLRDNIISSLNFLIFYPFYKINKTKFFLSIHGNLAILGMRGKLRIIYDFLIKIGLLISDKIIVVSPELKDYFSQRYKIKKEKFEIVVNFIKIDKNFVKNTSKKALIVSRIDKDKFFGISKSIEFCIKNNLELDIFGDGDFLSILKEKYKNNKINFLGFVKQEEIIYENYFLIFAMGRALLEGILNSLRGVLINNHEIICEINLKNYENAKYSNFTGKLVKGEKNLYENFIGKTVEKEEIFLEKNADFNLFEKIKNDFDIKNLKDFYT